MNIGFLVGAGSFLLGWLWGWFTTRAKKTKPVITGRIGIEAVTIHDWLTGPEEPQIDIRRNTYTGSGMRCYLSCKHRSSVIICGFIEGPDEISAFRNAIFEIEKTIGDQWRRNREMELSA